METHRHEERTDGIFCVNADYILQTQEKEWWIFCLYTGQRQSSSFAPEKRKAIFLMLWDKIEKILNLHPNLGECKCLFLRARETPGVSSFY